MALRYRHAASIAVALLTLASSAGAQTAAASKTRPHVVALASDPLAGRLVVYDALKTRFRELKLRRDPKCPTCGEGVDRSKIQLIDYAQFCAGN